jgi:hypothetical protein
VQLRASVFGLSLRLDLLEQRAGEVAPFLVGHLVDRLRRPHQDQRARLCHRREDMSSAPPISAGTDVIVTTSNPTVFGGTRRAIVIALTMIALGCTSGSTLHTSPAPTPPTMTATGTIVGRMVFTCGPLHGCRREIPLVGEVAIRRTDSDAVVAKVRTDREGQFRFTVPAGDYALEGTAPHISGTIRTTVSVSPHATAIASLLVAAS